MSHEPTVTQHELAEHSALQETPAATSTNPDDQAGDRLSEGLEGHHTPPPNALPVFLRRRNFSMYTNYLPYGSIVPSQKVVDVVDALKPHHGVALFESQEHAALGDYAATQLRYLGQPVTNSFHLANIGNLNFGQIIALAGDFFGVPSQPISDGSNLAAQQSRFLAAFNTLYNAPASEITNILKVMSDQAAEINQSVTAWGSNPPANAYSLAYSAANTDHKYDKRYNQATGGYGSGLWFLSIGQGSYLKLAETNWDHFGSGAVASYMAGHACAMTKAQGINAPGLNPQQKQQILNDACVMEAFACHYLTDLFSAGHLRTPRRPLGVTDSSAGDPCAQLMHDEDSYNGLNVTNGVGASWVCYGDKRYFDSVNADNATQAQACLAATIQNLNAAFAGTEPQNTALDYIPNLTQVNDPNNRLNWSPLFTMVGDTVKRRSTWEDLLCYDWTMLFVYSFTWAAVPAGGVHSLFGTPPGGTGQSALNLKNITKVRLSPPGGGDVGVNSPSAVIIADPNATVGDDATLHPRLHVVYRDSSAIRHLSTSMSNAPTFSASCDISEHVPGLTSGCAGDPSLLECEVGFLLIYADSSGTLWQCIYDARTTTPTWTTPLRALPSGAPKVQSGTRPSLCSADNAVFMVFSDQSSTPNVWIARATVSSAAPYITFATPQKAAYQSTKSGAPVTNAITSMASPTIVEFDGCLLLAAELVIYGIVVFKNVLASGQLTSWVPYDVAYNSGSFVTTGSALQLIQNAGGWGLLGKSTQSSHSKAMYLGYDAPTWQPDMLPSNLSYTPSQLRLWSIDPLGYTASGAFTAVFQGGVPYIVFSDASNKNYLRILVCNLGPAQNLANGQAAIADSSQAANPASNGNDGLNTTRWCANDSNKNHYWQVDLGAPHNLTGTVIRWEQNHAYQYKVDTSTDAKNWHKMVDKSSNKTAAAINTDPFSTTARYVRVTVTGGLSSATWASFYECAVLGY